MGIYDAGEVIDEKAPGAGIASYLRAFGVDVPDGTDVFQETSEGEGMPTELYVLHDPEMLATLDENLSHQSVGLISPLGTGKTALREITLREFGQRDEYILDYLGGGGSETTRGILVRPLRRLLKAGYDFDGSVANRVVDGVPWKTEEVEAALGDVARQAAADGRNPVLIVDQIEKHDQTQLDALQAVLDAGVRLFLMGTPRGRETVSDVLPALENRVRWIDRSIKPFEPGHTAEYTAKSLARASSGTFDGPTYGGDLFSDYIKTVETGPFTADALEELTSVGRGNPRLIRLGCLTVLEEAARAAGSGHDEMADNPDPIDRELVQRTADTVEWAGEA